MFVYVKSRSASSGTFPSKLIPLSICGKIKVKQAFRKPQNNISYRKFRKELPIKGLADFLESVNRCIL